MCSAEKFLPSTAWKPRPEAPPEELSAITTTDVIPGTPLYLAPEQVAGTRDLDARVDVWAAGLTFYEMLTGERAFDGASYATLVTNILRRPLPLLSSFRDDLPAGFEGVLGRAVAKNRAARFPNAPAFRKAIVEEWARFRTAGVARGDQLRRYYSEAVTLPVVDESPAEDMTAINVHVEYDPGD